MSPKPLSLSLPLALLVAAACGPPGVQTIDVDGRQREYLLHVPDGLSGTVPLLVVLHGGGRDAASMRRLTDFDGIADREGFIVVYPNAWEGHWNDGRVGEKLRANAEGVDDVELIDEVLDRLILRLPVDQSRLYVTGASNGGIFTLALACSEVGPRLAGIAPVIGAFAEGAMAQCEARPLAVQLLNGSEDELVPPGGGEVASGGRGRVESLEDTTGFWVEQNGCVDAPAHEEVDAVADDGTALLVDTWATCERAVEVKRILVEGGGHTWAGADEGGAVVEAVVGKSSAEIDASEAAWQFLSRFERR